MPSATSAAPCRTATGAGVTTETLAALAPVLKTTVAWLLEGVGDADASASIRVVGRIGAGAEIMPEYEQIPPEGLFEIELAFPLPPEAVAFAVEGDSMWPRYNSGDVVICGKPEVDAHALTGSEAAVRTSDGKRYLKTIRRGPKAGTFDLESHNAPPIPRHRNRMGGRHPDDPAGPPVAADARQPVVSPSFIGKTTLKTVILPDRNSGP